MLNIIHKTSAKGVDYAVIAGISPLGKGMECPEQVNKSFIWNYNDHFDLGILENLHEWFRDKIKGSLEYKAVLDPIVTDDDFPKVEDAPLADPEEVTDLPF